VTATSHAFAAGDVLNYIPRWHHCREGSAIVLDNGCAVDTFWSNDRAVLTAEELATADLRFRLDDYRKLGESWDDTLDEWLTYAPADRQVITSQHGLQAVHYVRIGAEPGMATQIGNAREAVALAQGEVRSAERRLGWRREELAALESSVAGEST
jgi:hypothetical protein